MIQFSELKARPDLVGAIDWEITPQQAFEDFQLKSIDGWRKRGLGDAVYFQIDVWQQKARLVLIRRTHVDSEEICQIPAPPEMVAACLAAQAGENPSHGQYPIDDALKDWLRRELGL